MYIRQLFTDYKYRLLPRYDAQEAENLVLWLFERFLSVQRKDILQNRFVKINADLKAAIEKLETGVPIQYVLEEAPFYGRYFYVNPSVLIPRNETEELVHLILQENQEEGLQILDVGTGSGCIPITLALEMPHPIVTAIDLSRDALVVAQRNAERHQVGINYILCDVLSEALPVTALDIVVSNPPYVRESEKASMHQNVLDHEPHLALFVPEDDALVFYRVIARKSLMALKPGGKLYFEINESLGAEMVSLLSSLGYRHVRLMQDLNGKDRMVAAIR